MPTLVAAEGALLARAIDALPPSARDGLSAAAFAKMEQALGKTAWAKAHRRRVALMDGDVVLATAVLGRLAARLDAQPVQVCAVGSLWADPARSAESHAAELIAGVIDAERRDGADLAIVAAPDAVEFALPDGFEPLPTTDVDIRVVESTRHGAPMTMVRGGEDRDLAAIVAMGEARARLSRFHLVRDRRRRRVRADPATTPRRPRPGRPPRRCGS